MPSVVTVGKERLFAKLGQIANDLDYVTLKRAINGSGLTALSNDPIAKQFGDALQLDSEGNVVATIKRMATELFQRGISPIEISYLENLERLLYLLRSY